MFNADRCAIPTMIALALAGLAACSKLQPAKPADEARQAASERALARRLQAACSSPATYDRLKQVAFEEAVRVRNADPVNLDTLATFSTVRMENPVVKSRDKVLDVTVCSGRFVLDLPPGAERAFGGERRLTADVEYAAQMAADGSGLVYQIKGAEPIIYKLAAFDLRRQTYAAATPRPTAAAPNAAVVPAVAPQPQPQPTLQSAQVPVAPVRQARVDPPNPSPRPSAPAASADEDGPGAASPSFNCRRARARSERMVCSSPRLAALDRAMSSQFYSALSGADGPTRSELRRSRDRFLAFRNRCSDEDCVAQAYRDRMDEIRDIARGR